MIHHLLQKKLVDQTFQDLVCHYQYMNSETQYPLLNLDQYPQFKLYEIDHKFYHKRQEYIPLVQA